MEEVNKLRISAADHSSWQGLDGTDGRACDDWYVENGAADGGRHLPQVQQGVCSVALVYIYGL